MRKDHADPTRKLLIQRIQDAEAGARRIRRGAGRRWGAMDQVFSALVGIALRNHLHSVVLAIFNVQDMYGETEGTSWLMPSLPAAAREAFAVRGFIRVLDAEGRITVEGDALADAYEATLTAMANRQIPDNFVPPPTVH